MTSTTNTSPRLVTAGTVDINETTWQVRTETNPARFDKYDTELAATPWIIRTPYNLTIGFPVAEEPDHLDVLKRVPHELIKARTINPPRLVWEHRTNTDGIDIEEAALCTLTTAAGDPVHVTALVSEALTSLSTRSDMADLTFMMRHRHGPSDWRLVLPTRTTQITYQNLAARLATAVLPF